MFVGYQQNESVSGELMQITCARAYMYANGRI